MVRIDTDNEYRRCTGIICATASEPRVLLRRECAGVSMRRDNQGTDTTSGKSADATTGSAAFFLPAWLCRPAGYLRSVARLAEWKP